MTSLRNFMVHSSDFTGRDLVIVDEDGNKLENITELTVRFRTDSLVTFEIEMVGKGVNVKGKIDTVDFVCPGCGDLTTHTCEPMTLGGT
jgi:hypothetical protein